MDHRPLFGGIPTVHGEVPKRSASGPLHFNVGVLEEEKDRIEGIAVDGSDICSSSLSQIPRPGR